MKAQTGQAGSATFAEGPPRLDHVGINVADLDAAADWYVRAFGLDREIDLEIEQLQLRISMLRSPHGYRIELLERVGSVPGPCSPDPAAAALVRGLGHFAVTVPDVEAAYAALLDIGARPAMTPRDSPEPGVRMAFVRDPEGNLVELVGRPS